MAAKRGKVKALAEGFVKELTLKFEKAKPQVRSRVEHLFHIIKNLFKHRNVCIRGLAKKTAQFYSLFALANLVIRPERPVERREGMFEARKDAQKHQASTHSPECSTFRSPQIAFVASTLHPKPSTPSL